MKAPLKRTKWLAPYTASGKTNFPARGCAGVYVIRKGERIVYVGFSTIDVYKALYRHFQVWNDPSRDRDRVTYTRLTDVKVRVIYCRTAAWARQLEKALILKHRPKDNPDKLSQYTITPDGEQYAQALDNAEWIVDKEVPF